MLPSLCLSPACSARVDNTGVSSSSFALITGVSGKGSALVSSPLACFSFYWTLFCQQSRREERRGTLIAHLNGGCHIINAYRPAIQPVTETPSHSSREEGGEWDINSCELRDGHLRPEIKWLALKEMRPEMRCLLQLEHMWSAQHGPPKSDPWPFYFPVHLTASVRRYESTQLVRTCPNRSSLKFGVFMPFAYVFNCCRQQTVIPLKLPCVHVCVSLFFWAWWEGLGGCWKMPDCVFMCVCVCMRDVQRNAL